MTYEEFEQLSCGDKVYDKEFKKEGIVKIVSHDEKFIDYPDVIGLMRYNCEKEGSGVYVRLEKI